MQQKLATQKEGCIVHLINEIISVIYSDLSTINPASVVVVNAAVVEMAPQVSFFKRAMQKL
jgi:hypothetical protein